MRSTSTRNRSSVYAGLGLCYGLLLTCIGCLGNFAGHGTEGVAESLSSPFGLFAKTEPAVFGAIAFWCAVGALLGSVRDWVARLLFLLSMVAQYIVLSVILWRQSLLQPWWSNEKYHEVMLYAIIGYSLGQTAIWVLFFYEVLLVGFKQTQVDSAATDHSRLND